MNKKDYIEKAKSTILNRVKFHAPVVYDGEIDKRTLFVNGIDINKPIFKFDKQLNKSLLKAFELAQNEQDFNLVMSLSSLGKIKENRLKNLKNCVLFSNNSSSVSFLEMINKLNINYQSNSNYNVVYKDKFLKINDKILNPKYEEFSLVRKEVIDKIFVEYYEFLLNGKNFFVKFCNTENMSKKVDVELNLPLARGYYFFKKINKSILIENLMTKEKFYLNCMCKNAKFSFSNVDGLENSVYCCVNVKLKINLEGKTESCIFFNFGGSKFCPKNHEAVKKLLSISKKMCCEMFNLRVKTKDTAFDNYFNKVLPMKIWIDWLNDGQNLLLEEKYLTLKKLFIRGENELSFVKFKEIGLKELGIFNGDYYKKILIVDNAQKFLKVGTTVFHNINGVTHKTLTSKEPICLSFGDF